MKQAARDNIKKNAEENTKLVSIKDQHISALFKESVNVFTMILIFTAT